MSFAPPFILALCALPPIPLQYQYNPQFIIHHTNSCLKFQSPYTHLTLPPPPFKCFDRLESHVVYIKLTSPPSPAITKLPLLTFLSPFSPNISVTNTHHINFFRQGALCELSFFLVRNINYTLTYFLYILSLKSFKLLQFYYFRLFIIIYNRNDISSCIILIFHVSPTFPIIYSITPTLSNYFQIFSLHTNKNYYRLFYYFQTMTKFYIGNINSYCIKGNLFVSFFCVSNTNFYKHPLRDNIRNAISCFITNMFHVLLPLNLIVTVFFCIPFINIYALVKTIYRLTETLIVHYNLLSILFYKNLHSMSQLSASGNCRFSPYSKGWLSNYFYKHLFLLVCLKISGNNQFFKYLYIFSIILDIIYSKKRVYKINNG